MAGADVLLAFALATAVFAYFPGPALLYTIAQTLARGRRGGLMAALGIHLGGYAHVLAATLGLSALFRHVPELFLVVKIAGALYLVWLGIGMLRSSDNFATLPGAASGVPDKSVPRALVDSFIVELLNPKVALFFIAFLPQFIDPKAPFLPQMTVFGATFITLAFINAFGYALVASRARGLVGNPAAIRWFNRAGGTLLIGAGVAAAAARGARG